MEERRLVAIGRFGDALSADALVAFLAANGIAAHVEGADPLAIGLGGSVRVVIAEEDLRRAREALDVSDLSDGEAWFLATGELDPDAAYAAFHAQRDNRVARRRIALRVAAVISAALLVSAALARL